jgi:arabinofuranan 3-O-arabinosyltransferase
VVGAVGDALNGDSMQLRACLRPGEPTAVDGGAVALPAGETLLETTSGAETGLDVDMLSLASGPGGIAGIDTLEHPSDDGPTPPDSTTERTARNVYEVTTTGADQPYWVVLGQSYGPGWVATTSDGKDLGEPTLVNGYANGWRVDPADVGADTTIRIHWAPQRYVWFGLGLSALGVLICLGLIVIDPRRRRAQRDADGHDADEHDADMVPIGVSPLAVDGAALAPLRAIAFAVAAGVVGFVVGGAVIAAVVAVVAGVSLGLRRGQLVVRAACVGLLALAFAYIVAKQSWNGYQIDFDWVQWFEITHDWALLATVLLVVDVAVDGLRRSASAPIDEG